MGETVANAGEIRDDVIDEVELDVDELEALDGSDAEPPARASVPPPLPPDARGSERTHTPGSRSGTWRVAEPAARPAPTLAADVSALQRELERLEKGARDNRASIARLRLGLKLRDDRIAGLESELASARHRVAELERAAARRPPDDLKRIGGVGPKYERALHGLGIKRFDEIAAWQPADLERVARSLGVPTVRVQPWIAQARTLCG